MTQLYDGKIFYSLICQLVGYTQAFYCVLCFGKLVEDFGLRCNAWKVFPFKMMVMRPLFSIFFQAMFNERCLCFWMVALGRDNGMTCKENGLESQRVLFAAVTCGHESILSTALTWQVCAPDSGPARPLLFQGTGQNCWGLRRRPWGRAPSPIAGGIQSVSPSYGNDLGLWVAGIWG